MSKQAKRLLTIRHGSYNGNLLTDYGVEQIESLSNKIQDIVDGKKIAILSSAAGRAEHSASIIADRLSAKFESHDILWSESNKYTYCDKVYNLVMSYVNDVDVIILVTHYEYTEEFPSYFAKEYLNETVASHVIDKGFMWDLDWSEGSPNLNLICPF